MANTSKEMINAKKKMMISISKMIWLRKNIFGKIEQRTQRVLIFIG